MFVLNKIKKTKYEKFIRLRDFIFNLCDAIHIVLTCLASHNSFASEEVSFELLKEDLECPVCMEVPTSLPIYQCLKGHIICNSCYPKLYHCPVCRISLTPQVRALLAEKILQKHRGDVPYNPGPSFPAGEYDNNDEEEVDVSGPNLIDLFLGIPIAITITLTLVSVMVIKEIVMNEDSDRRVEE